MDLQNFVAESLTQIVKGIADAQERCKDLGVRINPRSIERHGNTSEYDSDTGDTVEAVDFDVAVTAKSTSATGGGGGISVWAITAEGKHEQGSSAGTVSRIKFRVRVILPSTDKRAEDRGPLLVV